MMTLFDVKKSKTLSKWMLSYLTILMIPIIMIGMLLLLRNAKNAEKQVIQYNTEKTQNLARLIDDRLYEIMKLNVQWSVSPIISRVVEKFSRSDNSIDYTEYVNVLGEIRNHIAVNEMILDIFIAVPNSQLMLSAYGKDSFDLFFRYSYVIDDELYNTIISKTNEYTHFTLLGTSNVTMYAKNANVLLAVQSLRYSVLRPRATLIIVIDPEYIKNIISSVFRADEGTLYILNNDNTLVLSNTQNSSAAVISAPESQGLIRNGDTYSYSVNSQVSGWKYVFEFDRTRFGLAGNEISKYILSSALLAFLFGIAIVMFFVYRNYNPLYRLFLNAPKNSSVRSGKMISEFDVIEDSIRFLSSQKADFEQKLLDYEPVIKKDLLTKIIKGYFSSNSDILKAMREAGLECNDHSGFCVLALELLNSAGESSGQLLVEKDVRDKLSVIYLLESLLIEHGYAARVFESDYRKIASLICLKEYQTSGFLSDIDLILDKVKSKLSVSTDNELYTVTGEMLNDPSGISRSFLKAENALERAVFIGENDEDNSEAIDSFYFYPSDWEIQLMNNLKLGNGDAVNKLLDSIRAENCEARSLNIDLYKRLITELLETGMKVISELDIDFTKKIPEYRKIIGSKSGAEMWLCVEGFYSDICEKVREIRTETDSVLNNDLIKYVDDNLTESDMSLIKVSDKFRLHPSTISRMFKLCTGYKFLDYINRNRIEKAKELMDTTTEEIYRISEKVGYINYTSFSRVFSRYAGISPNEYRNISHSNHKNN